MLDLTCLKIGPQNFCCKNENTNHSGGAPSQIAQRFTLTGEGRMEKIGESFYKGERKKMCEGARGGEVKQLRGEQEKLKKGCLDLENQAHDSKV